nr:structural maintenance of chromosomes flexible hinge domain-containing protein 1-like; partial [Biomphalaria glabrata]
MAAPIEDSDNLLIFVHDRRTEASPEVKLSLSGIQSYLAFRDKIKEVLKIDSDDFVIATTSREEIKDQESFEFIENGDTFYILKEVTQELCAPTHERVDYLPHYDTIVKGGMYEYYASEGQNPLPYAFAELIDNSIAATVLNDGPRQIELRLYLDDAAVNKNCIVVIDNGKGMTPRQLNNWAIYRLSKFTRQEKRLSQGKKNSKSNPDIEITEQKIVDDSLSPAGTWAPKFMNSDISYFGVGGKQAVFFIGTSVRMISKPKESTDVHELVISKEEFEKREKNNQSIYTGYIKNRKPGDTSHIHSEEDNLIKLITEEPTRGSFTAVVIQGVNTQHVTYLKQNFKMWTRQLAHIYHFYLHGPDGNKENVSISPDTSPFNNINITVNVHIRGHPNPKSVELRTIIDDMQSMFVRTAASTFDFKAYVDGSTAVEGVIRYHPFLYDKETYPSDIYGVKIDTEPEDDHGYAINDRPARGRRPIFETYWNGRLIPYTVIEDFDWCSLPKRQKNIPSECYNRISGVLWTNDSFQVSTNKLTFMDLELKLKDKNTNFVRIVNGHDKRTSIEREFQSWLKECNELYDKQIFFLGNQGQVTRTDLPRHKQIPWTKFSMVEWDGKVYDTGLMVRILRTTPALYGTIQAFYLYGEYEGDIYAMGGDIEILQEPQSLYSERRFVPINKLDRGTSTLQIKKYIEEEESKLPDHLIVTWPNGMEVVQNEKRNAGKTIGDIKVEISNKRGEKISKIPFSAAGTKKLLVELKLIWHASNGDETIVSLVSQHGKTWPYWFRKMDSAKNLGNYTLQLNTVLNESGNTLFAGKELPSYKIKFSVIEADPEKFTVGILDGPFKVGVPFQIPLEFQDKYNNSTRAPAKLKPMLDADGLELSYENTQIKGNSCFIKGVVAKGIVTRSSEKSFNLKVSIPGLEQTHLLKIRLLPGPAANLVVKPETEITIENGSAPTYFLEVQDIAGNITSGTKLNVVAKMMGASGLPIMVIDCSATGTATLVCKPIFIKNMSGEKNITVVFDIQGSRGMSPIERIIRVVPSNRASVIKASYKSGNKEIEIKNGDILELEAGTELNPIMFEVLNEAGEILELDDKLAAKIKVNWAPKSLKDQLQRKCLPPLKVSTSVLEPKYCSISLMEGEGIELQFTVRSLPAPASQLLCELKGESSTLLGEQLQGAILVSMKDKFGNHVPYLNSCKEITCSGDGLKVQELIKTLDNQKCLISNLIFTSMGMKEVEVKWKELKSSVKFEVKAGAPTQLEVLDWVVDEPILVFSGKPLSQPFRVQLLDAEKNPCHLNNVKVQIVRDQKLKLHPAPVFVRTDNLGIADFGVLTITANSGIYDIQPKANIFKTVINGPKLIVNVQPDPLKPSAVEVSYNPKMTITAGQTFPDFTVTVISEDGSLLRSATLDQVSMRLWRKEPEAANAKPEIIQFQASNKEDVGTFSFKKCQVPETSGNYNVMFVYSGGSVELLSIVNTLIVNPGSPAELISLDRRTTPTVSNTKSAASRTLIKSLVLELRDEFHNSLTKGYNGKVKVQITSAKKMDEIPVFVNGDTLREFPLLAGQCTLQNLILQENASGKDGFEYTLSCTVQCELIPKNKPVPPLDIPFLFYNVEMYNHALSTDQLNINMLCLLTN